MEENGTYAALITINSCFIALMITIIFIRKTFFQERLDELDIEIGLASEDFKSNLSGFYGGKGEDLIYESFMDTRIEYNKLVNIHTGLTKGDIKIGTALKTLINQLLSLKDPRTYKSKNLNLPSINKNEATELLHEMNEISHRISLLISITEKSEKSEKLKHYYTFIENSKEEYLRNKEKILSLIRLHEKKNKIETKNRATNSNKIIFLISYQCIIGIFIPLFLISTLHYNERSIHLFYTYDFSIFVGLSLITASMLPYTYIIGYGLAQLKTHK
jgi:hypothetical protein